MEMEVEGRSLIKAPRRRKLEGRDNCVQVGKQKEAEEKGEMDGTVGGKE